MKDLRILSMNLGRSFIPVRNKKRIEIISKKLVTEGYDLVMLQGEHISRDVNLDYLKAHDYKSVNYNDKAITLAKNQTSFCRVDAGKENLSSSFLYYDNKPLVCVNVNCKDDKGFYDVYDLCSDYSREDSQKYVPSRIVAGRFPREVDTNTFCDNFNLEDVSSLVAQNTHILNNREIVNHLFISRDLEWDSVKKLVGMTEISRIGEAYPIEASIGHKKVLK